MTGLFRLIPLTIWATGQVNLICSGSTPATTDTICGGGCEAVLIMTVKSDPTDDHLGVKTLMKGKERFSLVSDKTASYTVR